MSKIIDLHAEILAARARGKADNLFQSIDTIIDDQSEALIRLGLHGTLDDFVVMRPINPSVVHCIIVKLISNS